MEYRLHLPWQVPFGEFILKLDPLSFIFLLSVMILVVCAGAYGIGYMRRYIGQKNLWIHAFFYLLFALSLLVILTADTVILFLGAWELMTLSTFFLIIFHEDKQFVRKAGFIYLAASHCATFALFLMFLIMANSAGSMTFSVMAKTVFPLDQAGLIFLLAFAGFGVKAGFIPEHIWLPHAHPAAPSHVSALLSGVAIKMGIYGICRVIWMLGVLPDWCGYFLLFTGIFSGLMGVLYALGQHELKKLLAYHSIENIGIIAIGIGAGLLGLSYHHSLLAALGFGGALLHVFNHSIFKALLFLGAGSVIQRTNTGDIDRLGGLARTIPVTSILFLIGALSICGLPVFNGFISEFIIFVALFQGVSALSLHGVLSCASAILSLALMGILALTCFCKVFGVVFLGHNRRQAEVEGGLHVSAREDTSAWMLLPMTLLAGICVWVGISPWQMLDYASLGASYMARQPQHLSVTASVNAAISGAIGLAVLFIFLVIALSFLRRAIIDPARAAGAQSWNCGYAYSSVRFQYTASSFVRSILDFAGQVLLFRRHGGKTRELFPAKCALSSEVNDLAEARIFRPVINALTSLSCRINENRFIYTQVYLMYIFLFLIFLLIWKLR